LRAGCAGSCVTAPSSCTDWATSPPGGLQNRVRLALVDTEKLKLILARVLDPERMLSDHGVRSVSKFHRDHPLHLDLDGHQFTLDYVPAESNSPLFGGNSNWRGPVWFPLNFLLIEALQKHDACLGETFKVECPSARTTSSRCGR
jgi:hypothetical protein